MTPDALRAVVRRLERAGINVRAACPILAAGMMLVLGEMAPEPQGLPYFVLAAILAAYGLFVLWRCR